MFLEIIPKSANSQEKLPKEKRKDDLKKFKKIKRKSRKNVYRINLIRGQR